MSKEINQLRNSLRWALSEISVPRNNAEYEKAKGLLEAASVTMRVTPTTPELKYHDDLVSEFADAIRMYRHPGPKFYMRHYDVPYAASRKALRPIMRLFRERKFKQARSLAKDLSLTRQAVIPAAVWSVLNEKG